MTQPPPKKTPVRAAPTKKAPVKAAPAKKTAVKAAPAKKTAVKAAPAKKTPAKATTSALPKPVTLPRGDAALWRRRLDTSELARHVAHCRAPAATTYERGKRLEQLATWLFPHLPGLSVDSTNVFDSGGSHEVDVPLFNDIGVRGSLFALGTNFYVECKNYEHRVGGQEVAWFLHKLIQGAGTAGVLLTTEGITGDAQDRTFAQGVVHEAKTGNPARWILIVTLDDIEALASTADLYKLLTKKISDNSVGRSI